MARRAFRWTRTTFVVSLLVASACTDAPPVAPEAGDPALARAGYDTPGAHRQYGTPVKLGRGHARAYVVLDAKAKRPLELGVALDERAMDGLPSHTVMLRPPLPPSAPAPWTFAMLDWNPMGHEPPGVYDLPHFDFHFYRVPESEVDAIVPSDPDWATKANNVPVGDAVPPFYVPLGGPGQQPADIAVPGMGVHWSDLRSPELQAILGNAPDWAPFTKTFIYGSWDGEFTFLEPMITRAYLLGRPSETIPIPTPAAYPEPGWYPDAYRITWDPQAKEYRIGLIGLTWHD